MALASNNPFPSVLVVEGTVPASPASGDQRLYIDSADHKLKRVNSSGTVTTVESGAAGVTQIAQQVLGSAAASITFSGISGSYSKLVLDLVVRSDRASNTTDDVIARFNSDSGSNYDYHLLEATGSNTTAATITAVSFAAAFAYLGKVPAATAPTSVSGAVHAELPLYAGTTFHKTMRVTTQAKLGASTGADLHEYILGNWWRSTAAITSIVLSSLNGANFVTGTVATLYGIT